MGVSHEDNRIHPLTSEKAMEDFKNRLYPDAEPEDVPIFEMGEEIVLRGYVFKVIQVAEHQLALRPVRVATRQEKQLTYQPKKGGE